MPTVYLAPGPFGAGGQFFDANGAPLNAGRISTFAAGTSTPLATYTTAAGSVANANPVILNSDGRSPQEIWLLAANGYQFEVVTSVSGSLGTYDNLYGIGDPTTNNNIGYTGATISGAIIMNAAPINEAQGANIPVAAAINLTDVTGNYLSLTGSGTVTAIQLSQGAYRELVVNTVSSAFTNSATMALLGGASFTPAVGDILGFRGEAAPVVRQVLYSKASGLPVTVTPTPIKIVSVTYALTNGNTTLPVTGAGFTPRLARLALGFGTTSNAGSIGETDGTAQWCLYSNNAAAAGQHVLVQSGIIAAAILNATDNTQFNLGAFTSDGLTFSTVINGTPTGVVNLSFTFMR